MATGKTPIDKLAASIEGILEEYSDDVERRTVDCVRAVSKAGAQAIRQQARGTFKRHTGKYATGWTYRVEARRTGAVGEIYNKDRPGLAHLLEHGHVSRNGTGRTFGRVPAHEHIAPVEKEIAKSFENAIKVELS